MGIQDHLPVLGHGLWSESPTWEAPRSACEAESPELSRGKDSSNLCPHAKPGLDVYGDAGTAVCDSQGDRAWRAEPRSMPLPQPGAVMRACRSFGQADLTLKLPEECTLKSPDHLNLEAINYPVADGDTNIKCQPHKALCWVQGTQRDIEETGPQVPCMQDGKCQVMRDRASEGFVREGRDLAFEE
ncbi:hypothetical protein GH733_006053 [Mirounga leonina]|nr:hypothetical protein GH733_006053 [Mirounga leonina]